MSAFKYDFGEDSIENRLLIMNGYLQAIQQLFIYLRTETQSNPEKRYIDAADLSDKIGDTCAEIEKLQAEYKTELSLLNLFNNGL